MRRISIVYTVSCVALLAFALQGCKRSNGIDNNQVIVKPYTLYFADTNGFVFNTNDAQRYISVFPTDGIPTLCLLTSDTNVLKIKKWDKSVFTLEQGSNNFNPVYNQVALKSFGERQMINMMDYITNKDTVYDRIYLVADEDGGVVFNDSNGRKGSPWFKDNTLPAPQRFTSLANLKNGAVVAFDDDTRTLFVKANSGAPWVPKAGTGLPSAGTGRFEIRRFGNTLVAYAISIPDMVPPNADTFGIWYSNDMGDNFFRYPDIDKNPDPNVFDPVKDITVVYSPFDKVLMAGSLTNGIWRLSGQNEWEYAYYGIEDNSVIRSFSAHNNIYKNEAIRDYVFAATSKGLYRSDDMGQNWIKVRDGNYITVY